MEKNKEDGKSLFFCLFTWQGTKSFSGLGPIFGIVYAHNAVHSFLNAYKHAGVELPDVKKVEKGIDYNGSIILAPPAVEDSSWTKIFAEQEEDLRRAGWLFVDQERERMWIEALFCQIMQTGRV